MVVFISGRELEGLDKVLLNQPHTLLFTPYLSLITTLQHVSSTNLINIFPFVHQKTHSLATNHLWTVVHYMPDEMTTEDFKRPTGDVHKRII